MAGENAGEKAVRAKEEGEKERMGERKARRLAQLYGNGMKHVPNCSEKKL